MNRRRGGEPDLEAAVHDSVTPTRAEVIRAKKALRRILADGKPYGIHTLQSCLLTGNRAPAVPVRNAKLELANDDDITRVATPDHPILARNRLALAAAEALIDLVAQGLVVDVANAPDNATANPIVGPDDITIGYQLAGHGASVRHATALPQLAAAYRLAPRFVHDAAVWFLDPDLFTADLDGIGLDRRTRHCLSEALDTYRNGLFLACANLLGAASEGAWYAAGEQLRTLDPQLAKALDSDNTTKVRNRVGEVLRQHGPIREQVAELHAQAALLRQLRNYGVHPRPRTKDHIERYLTDTGSAILLMETHTYMSRLADAVAARLNAAAAEPM